ncbi:hypothetical protein PI125_g22031 [Phytophthora idaei]|nr:hypothetical protein PI125_g22031 [Phytophthora idaei]
MALSRAKINLSTHAEVVMDRTDCDVRTKRPRHEPKELPRTLYPDATAPTRRVILESRCRGPVKVQLHRCRVIRRLCSDPDFRTVSGRTQERGKMSDQH